jgi:NADP-dependent 3-hydroxy acid dehydrogenase YdfG
VITGASAGIGAATARLLHQAGFDLVLGARRLDRLAEVAEPLGAAYHHLDVCDTASCEAFAAKVDVCHVLVNNAGGARGLDRIDTADEDDWRWMFEANVLGPVRMVKALIAKLRASGDGHIVTLGSVAGVEAYAGGGGYNAAKYGAHAVNDVLRLELLGEPIRVTEVAPGAVRTEFSLTRFKGDEEKSERPYAGITPLTADDVADVIAFAVTRPSNVNIDYIALKPVQQASAKVFHRNL